MLPRFDGGLVQSMVSYRFSAAALGAVSFGVPSGVVAFAAEGLGAGADGVAEGFDAGADGCGGFDEGGVDGWAEPEDFGLGVWPPDGVLDGVSAAASPASVTRCWVEVAVEVGAVDLPEEALDLPAEGLLPFEDGVEALPEGVPV